MIGSTSAKLVGCILILVLALDVPATARAAEVHAGVNTLIGKSPEAELTRNGVAKKKQPPYGACKGPLYRVDVDGKRLALQVSISQADGNQQAPNSFDTGAHSVTISERSGTVTIRIRRKGGSKELVKTLAGHLVFGAQENGRVFLFINSSHHILSMEGFVYVISGATEQPTLQLFTRLPDPAEFVGQTEFPSAFYALSKTSVTLISPYGGLSVLSAYQYYLDRPTSIAQVGDAILVGQCGGVGVLRFPGRFSAISDQMKPTMEFYGR